MANSRIARFFMEVAPPQYVSVMRRRTSKMMETIAEEDREISSIDTSVISLPKSSSTISACSSFGASACASSTNASVNTRYFLKEVHRTLSSLNN
ncbi:galactosyltransferase family protein [Trifolium repens]|nr:galactosyltransferase family protein [Trifolium repens]